MLSRVHADSAPAGRAQLAPLRRGTHTPFLLALPPSLPTPPNFSVPQASVQMLQSVGVASAPLIGIGSAAQQALDIRTAMQARPRVSCLHVTLRLEDAGGLGMPGALDPAAAA